MGKMVSSVCIRSSECRKTLLVGIVKEEKNNGYFFIQCFYCNMYDVINKNVHKGKETIIQDRSFS